MCEHIRVTVVQKALIEAKAIECDAGEESGEGGGEEKVEAERSFASRGKERVVRQIALLRRRERWEPQDLTVR